MGCCGQNSKEKSYVRGACSVCVEVDNDTSEKMVYFCEACNAYICSKHKTAIAKRTVAAVKVNGRKIIKLLKR